MWHFAGDGVSADNVNLILTNNSAVDGITFDWAVSSRDDVGAPCFDDSGIGYAKNKV